MRQSVVKPKTATEAQIMQQGLSARVAAFRDGVEDWLQEIATYSAQILLRELKEEDVARIMGEPTQTVDPMSGVTIIQKPYDWPQLTTEEVARLIKVKIAAGSTGAPNKLEEQENWQKLLPTVQTLVQMIYQLKAQGLDTGPVEVLLRETVHRFDDHFDADQLIPNIQTMPQQAAMQQAADGVDPAQAQALLSQLSSQQQKGNTMPDTEVKTEQNEQQETNDAQVAENQQQTTAAEETASESQNDEQQPSVAKAIDDLGIGPEEPKQETQEPSKDETASGAGKESEAKDGETQGEPADKKEPEKEPSDEELLVGIKSDRGRERLRKLLADGKQNSESLQAMQRTISASGLDRESFANLMEISRLVSSTDPADIEKGLKEFEAVRTRMYQALGREAPGVDLIAQHPDLANKVKSMGMTREDALQVIQARQVQEAEKQRYAAQKAQQQEVNRIQQFGQQVQQTFAARSKEADFDARIEILKKHFSRPGAVEQFVATHKPETWSQALMWMYDNAAPQHAPAAPAPAPITQSRARTAGVRVSHANGGSVASIEERMRELGL